MTREHEGGGEAENEKSLSSPESKVINIRQARERLRQKGDKEKNETSNVEFEKKKRETVERNREQLGKLREKIEQQRNEMQQRQEAFDSARGLPGVLNPYESKSESIYTEYRAIADKTFADIESGLTLMEETNDEEELSFLDETFARYLEELKKISSDQEKTLGIIPQEELDTMPEMVRNEILHQMKRSEQTPQELEASLSQFDQRLTRLQGGRIDQSILTKIQGVVDNAKRTAGVLKFLPLAQRLMIEGTLRETIANVDETLKKAERIEKR